MCTRGVVFGVPDMFILREATVDDVSTLARLHVETFIETHPSPDPPRVPTRERQWRELLAAGDPTRFCFVGYTLDGRAVGFASGAPHRGGVPGYAGELTKVYVLRAFQRQGLGRLLLPAIARRFLSLHITSMLLFGDPNSPANSFYEALGACRLLSASGEFHGSYGWPDLNVLARSNCS